ncbi:MAG: type II toxin-antitoxin system RelE/ParE family toxin [Planctomycetaceae bacterium]|jgi:plasmid stabilization system protein ParE|nr:type II toxin-antitoxin system RelE/ParE family toxin [Planctomycetaceae bacterium]
MFEQTRAKFRLVWRLRAHKQWNKILEFYFKRNQSMLYSLKLDERLHELLDLLCMENSTPGELTNKKGIRRISFEDRFTVFFRVKRNCIEVTSIVDARRDIRLN